MDKDLHAFKSHHKNKFNILFHIVCGFLYTALFFNLLGGWYGMVVYVVVLIGMFPHITAILIVVLLILILLDGVLQSVDVKTKIIMVIVLYMLPEVSHWITNEKTVLNSSNMNLISIIKNFFLLLPYSIMSLM